MSKRLVGLALGAFVFILIGWGQQADKSTSKVQIYTAVAGPYGSGKVSGNCPGPYSCSNPRCERCTPIDLHLPRTAAVSDIKCIGTKTLPHPDPSWLGDPAKSLQYGPNLGTFCTGTYDYSDFNVQWAVSSEVVSGYFRNWSNGIDRWVEVKVTYGCDPAKDNCTPPSLHVVAVGKQ
jgi:hypothetical protein